MISKIFRSVAVLCLMLVSTAAFAQKTTVKGVVKDTKGQTVIGAVVMLDGNSSVGTVTGADGTYTLSIPASAASPKLNVSCMGYTTQVVAVGKRSVIDFVLEDDAELLEEVVVVGYGSMRKSDLTGSVSSVKISEDEQDKTTSLDQMLMGRAAGVDVIMSSENPDAGVSVRIRGITSLNGSSEPLYVVDGVILTNPDAGTIGKDENEDVNGLMGINPQDIASIEVLKDASATAIYGASGANGVVLITTKQASKEKPTIQFNAGLDINTPYKFIEMCNLEQYEYYLRTRRPMDSTGYASTVIQHLLDEDGNLLPSVVVHDWQREFLKASPRQRYYLSISGRPKDLSYTLSLGYNNTKGVVPNSTNEQLTARLNIDKTLFKKLRIGTKVNLAYIKSRSMQGAGNNDNGVSTSFTKSLVLYRPFVNLSDVTLEEDEEAEEDDDFSKGSPTKWIKGTSQTRQEIRIIPSVYAEYKFTPWLRLRSSFGGDYHLQERTTYKANTITKGNPSGGITYGEAYNWNWDTTLNFNKKMKKHSVNATLGYTMSKRHNNTQTVNSSILVQDGNGIYNINSSLENSMSFAETERSNMSFFGRAMYNYADRYVLTATYRVDGSSLFGARNRFSGFPSFAFAWRMNQEPWFDAPAISTVKLRLGWGRVGNCSVSPYQTLSSWSSNNIGYHFSDAQYKFGLAPSGFANADLKWETTEQVNLGFDYAMWKGRLSLSVDAYYKNTYDLLQQRSLPKTSGYDSIWQNSGSIENKGIEFTLDSTPVIAGDFEWSLSGNLSLNRNRLTDLGYEVEGKDFYFEPGVKTTQYYYTGATVSSSGALRGAPINAFILGQPIGLFYGYRTDGLVKEGEFGVPSSLNSYENGINQQPGMVNYVDMNGNGYIDDDDRTVIGDSNPKFSYGFTSTFNYKGFRLNVVFQGVAGRQIYDANNMRLHDTHREATPSNISPESVFDAWTPANPDTPYTIFAEGPYYGYMKENFYNVFRETNKKDCYYATDRDVKDGSYLRISSLGLSYTFNLPKTSPVRRIGLGASVSNLVIWTKYDGFSPMVNSYKITSKRIGIDSGGSPASRSFCFDLKFTF